MNQETVLALFRRCEALLDGHFALSSGRHSRAYLQSALVLQYPTHASALGAALASRVADLRPGAVVAPALGGIVIGHEVARGLGIRGVFAERSGAHLALRRGFSLGGGERVVVVEDVVTTGGSTRETIEVVHAAGAEVVGVAAIVDRGQASFSMPFSALVSLSLPTFDPAECQLCARGVPLTKPGSRAIVP